MPRATQTLVLLQAKSYRHRRNESHCADCAPNPPQTPLEHCKIPPHSAELAVQLWLASVLAVHTLALEQKASGTQVRSVVCPAVGAQD